MSTVFKLYKQHCTWSIDRMILEVEIDNWLEDQGITAFKTHSDVRSLLHMIMFSLNELDSHIMQIEFENEIDALAFKLRWL